MKPISISERMMYNTVRIVTNDISCGTGSFFTFKIGNNRVLVIITNRHVVDDRIEENDAVDSRVVSTSFSFHTIDNNHEPEGFIDFSGMIRWIFHKDKDLCYCYVAPIFEEIKRVRGKDIYFISTDEKLIPSKEKLHELSALEEMTMVGYPIGLWDMRNNFPIFRKGFTACHPFIDFNRDEIGLVDIACFRGSSGSPIFLLNESGYTTKRGATHLGKSRLMLMGYLFEGPVYKADGEIIEEKILTHQRIASRTNLMINLGYYIKSSALAYFKEVIERNFND